jgi:hypothetical protein
MNDATTKLKVRVHKALDTLLHDVLKNVSVSDELQVRLVVTLAIREWTLTQVDYLTKSQTLIDAYKEKRDREVADNCPPK